MDVFLTILAYLLSVVGIIGCIVPALPGTAVSYLALLLAYATSYTSIESSTLWIWLAISLIVIVIDYIFPAMMTKAFGGSRAGTIGATVGVFAGLFMGPVGIILAPFFGAVIGELLHDKTDPSKAIRVGFGSFISFLVGTGIKLCASFYMLGILIGDTLPVLKNWIATTF